jgi:hypothetical protein
VEDNYLNNARQQARRAFKGKQAGRNGDAPPPERAGECDQQGNRPRIVISTEEHEVNAQAVEALTRDTGIYQRGGMLVRVVRDASPATTVCSTY